MDELYQQLKNFGTVKTNAVLAKYTTFKIGGTAQYLVEVNDSDKLVALLNFLSGQGVEFFILGGGSNLLLPDQEMDKVFIKIATNKLSAEGDAIIAEAGLPLARIVNEATKNSLSGLEWAAGIPGTVGGAVRGNAGAYGSDTSRNLSRVDIWRDGAVVTLQPEECGFNYRDSIIKHSQDVVLRAYFKLIPSTSAEIVSKTQSYIMERAGKFPPFPSAGSFFKNIILSKFPGDHSILPEKFVKVGKVGAAFLIEKCDLKGFAVGGAKISDEHANFLVNFNGATQADVLAVMEKAKEEVYNKYGVELEPEVEIVR